MNNECSLENINSKYILQKIFDYIKSDRIKLKLFFHCKSLQNKLNITKFDYLEIYLINVKIDIFNYFSSFSFGYSDSYDNKTLDNQLYNDLLKYNIDKKFFYEFITNYFNNNKSININNLQFLDIFSPFFDILSNTNLINKLIIPISTKIIEKYNLKKDFIYAFTKLNNSKFKYPAILLEFKDSEDMNYINELNINFQQIQKFVIYEEQYSYIQNYEIFFATIFSFNDIKNNLISLNIKFNQRENEDEDEKIAPYLVEGLNNFKTLEELSLEGFVFQNTFILKLNNLKKLSLFFCKNITFDKDSLLNLIELNIGECFINIPNSIMKLPILEKCTLNNSTLFKSHKNNLIFDFSSFILVKEIKVDICDFQYIKSNQLTNISLNSENPSTDSELEKKILRKLISLKALEKLEITFKYLNNYIITEISGKNNSLRELTVYWLNESCCLDNLQRKFPNLTYLKSEILLNSNNEAYIRIKDNINYNIKTLILNDCTGEMELICNYENIENIYINSYNKIKTITIFNGNKIFKSLSSLYFGDCSFPELKLDILKIIYKNIDKMPLLENFTLNCVCEDIEESFYKELIIKLLYLKLNSIKLFVKKNRNAKIKCYSFQELYQIAPNLNCNNLKEIKIAKFIYKNK